tara:strand:- start:446 stop:1222 length:777 start_codon:yes stop_codon:yes gene_type:complete
MLAYEEACMDSDYRYRFIGDMVRRLERPKALSQKQRKWLDSLIDEGAPAPKGDPVLIQKIKDAAELDGMQHRRQVLCDFAGTICRGYTLSEKQFKFLDIMLSEAEEIRQNGRYRPADPGRLATASSLLSGKSEWYWAHRRGTAKAYHKVQSWLKWNTMREVIEEVKLLGKETNHVLGEEPVIDEWSCEKVLKAAKTGLSEIDSPRHEVGALRYVVLAGKSIPGMVMTEPKVMGNDVKQQILVGGEMITCSTTDIRKRK